MDLASAPVDEYRALTRVEVWGADGRLGQLRGVVVDSSEQAVRYFVLHTCQGLRAVPAEDALIHSSGVILVDILAAWLPCLPAIEDVMLAKGDAHRGALN